MQIQIACKVKPALEQSKHIKISDNTIYLENHTFQFSQISDSNEEIYSHICSPIIQSVLEGHNQAIITYGQTGSGKSSTILGRDEEGILQKAVKEILKHRKLALSALNIHQDNLFDLLSECKLQIKDYSLLNLKEYIIQDFSQLDSILAECHKNRQILCSGIRSITIFILTLEKSKLFLVDNYGSERISKTTGNLQDQKDCICIGATLGSLGRMIQAVNSQHIPYRDSKLTRILQSAFTTNCKAAIILTCSLEEINRDETLSTLRFGSFLQRNDNKQISQKQEKNFENSTQVEQLLNLQRDTIKVLLQKFQSKEISESELIESIIREEQIIINYLQKKITRSLEQQIQ